MLDFRTKVRYSSPMTDLFSALKPGDLVLHLAPHAGRQEMLALAAYCALQGGAVVLDGGNRFNAYEVAYALRRRTANLRQVLDRILVARAFTCYQLVTLCQQTPVGDKPCLVLDMLDTFEAEDIDLGERMRVLRLCLGQLERLRREAPVVVSLAPPKVEPQAWEQMALLVRRAASGILEEGFMGKTIPTSNDIIRETEAILSKFWRVLQPEEKEMLKSLFAKAKKHVAAISEANHLLPFETVQQAMLLEQEKEIAALKEQMEELKSRLDG